MRRLQLAAVVAESEFPVITVDPEYHDGPIYAEVGTLGTGSRAFVRAVKLHCVDRTDDPVWGAVVSSISARDLAAPHRSNSDLGEDHLVNFIARFIPEVVAGRMAAGSPVLDLNDCDKSEHASARVAGERLEFVIYEHREWPLEIAQQAGGLRDSSVWVAAWNTDVRRYLRHLRPVDAELAHALDRRG